MMETMPSMADALRLTRSGDLRGATRLIQAALAGGSADREVDMESYPDVTPVRRPLARPGPAPTDPPQMPQPANYVAGGRFEERDYLGGEGRLSYRLYVPSGVKDGMPLLIMLHGCTQTPEDFALGTGMNRLADEMGFIVVYPRQTPAANMQRCWNWFKPGDQQRDKGEPALIAAVTRSIASEYKVDAGRIYVAGLSAGGATAAIMGAAYPDIYAAIGVHSGLACGAARDMPSAFAAMRNGPPVSVIPHRSTPFVPVITFHGDKDATVAEVNSGHIVASAARDSKTGLRSVKETGGSAGQHSFTRETSCDADGTIWIERWTIHGAGHAWSGGHASGSYTDARGPDASRAMIAFFAQHSLPHVY